MIERTAHAVTGASRHVGDARRPTSLSLAVHGDARWRDCRTGRWSTWTALSRTRALRHESGFEDQQARTGGSTRGTRCAFAGRSAGLDDRRAARATDHPTATASAARAERQSIAPADRLTSAALDDAVRTRLREHDAHTYVGRACVAHKVTRHAPKTPSRFSDFASRALLARHVRVVE